MCACLGVSEPDAKGAVAGDAAVNGAGDVQTPPGDGAIDATQVPNIDAGEDAGVDGSADAATGDASDSGDESPEQ